MSILAAWAVIVVLSLALFAWMMVKSPRDDEED